MPGGPTLRRCHWAAGSVLPAPIGCLAGTRLYLRSAPALLPGLPEPARDGGKSERTKEAGASQQQRELARPPARPLGSLRGQLVGMAVPGPPPTCAVSRAEPLPPPPPPSFAQPMLGQKFPKAPVTSSGGEEKLGGSSQRGGEGGPEARRTGAQSSAPRRWQGKIEEERRVGIRLRRAGWGWAGLGCRGSSETEAGWRK